MESSLCSLLNLMNQRSSNLQYLALATSIVLIGFGIYWYGPFFHQTVADSLNAVPPTSTSTVTLSTEKVAELEQAAADYRRLREEAGVSATSSNRSALSATVIGRPPQSPYDTLILNAGLVDGVKLEQAVWWPAGVHLGEIVDVRESSSVVELVSSPDVYHPAVIADVPVRLQGRGGDGLYAETPQSQSVAVGDAVISDQYNMPVGVVTAVKNISAQNIQGIYISRYASSPTIKTVYVEKN